MPARQWIKYWLPPIVWMVLIFSASADSQSGSRSSRIIGPIVRWLAPQAKPETVDAIVTAVRKMAHTVEYAVLSVLLWRACRRGRPGWTRRTAIIAFALSVLYALSDEAHQLFVPNRAPSALDVLIDSVGAAIGLTLTWVIGRWRRRW